MNLWGDIFRHYAHRCYWNLSIGCSQPRLCVHREKEVIFCTGPKCFFMMIVNISLKKMDELLRWNAFIVIGIGSGVKLKSRWAGEWGDIFPHASTGQWGFDESTLTSHTFDLLFIEFCISHWDSDQQHCCTSNHTHNPYIWHAVIIR